jgi:hypothetical protein
VSVADSNSGKHPENNPSYWQKDGCTKKMNACQKRFNSLGNLVFRQARTEATFPSVRFSGMPNPTARRYNTNSGCFHTTDPKVTGALDPRGEWTLVGWANINENSPRGAGIFSTSPGEPDSWPASRFININRNSQWAWRNDERGKAIQAQYIGYRLDHPDGGHRQAIYKTQNLGMVQAAQQENEEWNQYIVRHSTGTKDFIENPDATAEEREHFTTRLEVLVNGQDMLVGGTREQEFPNWREPVLETRQIDWWREGNHGNFASWEDRDGPVAGIHKCLPQTFMIGAQEFWRFDHTWPDPNSDNVLNQPPSQLATMNGHIGMWGLWNRALNEEELVFLKKPVIAPFETASYFDCIPRRYEECTGIMSPLTGGTGDGLPEGALPLLYGSGTLVAWWDGTTGNIGSPSHPTGALLDIHTGNLHLTGSGDYLGVDKTYNIDLSSIVISNPTSPDLRFGGFPGTDGFGYGRTR